MKMSRFVAFFMATVLPWSVMAGVSVQSSIFVDKSGRGQYKKIQDAVDSVPYGNNRWVRIHVAAGVYDEQVKIPSNKPYIFLEGEGRDQTFIQWSAFATETISDPETAAFSVMSENFVAKRITFKNTYNGNNVAPALAAILWSDKAAFYDCAFMGYQDTLCDMQGRHYFKNCRIVGAVDFIFGIGQSIYDQCEVVSTGDGWITAHGKKKSSDPSGFVFKNCSVTGKGKVYLGRAWGPFSTVIFLDSYLSDIVVPAGWESWFNSKYQSQIFYGESGCKGPGSDTSSRVSWERRLHRSALQRYSNMAYINDDGWIEMQP